MTLRQRLIVTVSVVSLLSAVVFSFSLYYVTRSVLNVSENRAVERSIEIAASAARDPAEQAEALKGFRAYHQLKAIRGLMEQRIIVAGLLFGVVIFALSIGISSIVMLRITRPLKELAAAIDRAGRGDLDVKVRAKPHSEVGSVVTAFNTMTERLRHLQDDLRRSERLAAWRDVARILGHEIRNPLTPIRLSVERLQLKSLDRSPDLHEAIEKSSRTILEEIEALDRLVGEFSEFARLPHPKLEPVDVGRLLSDIVAQFAISRPDVDFGVETDPDLGTVSADRDLLRRAATNIIKNSLEATEAVSEHRASRIAVSIGNEQGAVRIAFTDNGPGIPREQQQRVFDPYFTTKTKGTGLGLAVVKNIIAEHGGSVGLRSSKHGTEITISLPQGGGNEGQIADR